MGGGGSKSSGKLPFHSQYTVSKELGTGAFSVVKLATKKTTNETFAAKIGRLLMINFGLAWLGSCEMFVRYCALSSRLYYTAFVSFLLV